MVNKRFSGTRFQSSVLTKKIRAHVSDWSRAPARNVKLLIMKRFVEAFHSVSNRSLINCSSLSNYVPFNRDTINSVNYDRCLKENFHFRKLTCASARMRRIKAKVGCVVRSSWRASASPSLFKRFRVVRAVTEQRWKETWWILLRETLSISLSSKSQKAGKKFLREIPENPPPFVPRWKNTVFDATRRLSLDSLICRGIIEFSKYGARDTKEEGSKGWWTVIDKGLVSE